MNSNLNINDFFHESIVYKFYKNKSIEINSIDYKNLYFNVLLNSITNLILDAHKYHKLMLNNYKNTKESLKFKMMLTDLYIHVTVAHIIQVFTLIDEFQNLLNIYTDNIKVTFSIDFTLYNKMIKFKKYFIKLEKYCILYEMNFSKNSVTKNITNNITKNELESIYK